MPDDLEIRSSSLNIELDLQISVVHMKTSKRYEVIALTRICNQSPYSTVWVFHDKIDFFHDKIQAYTEYKIVEECM